MHPYDHVGMTSPLIISILKINNNGGTERFEIPAFTGSEIPLLFCLVHRPRGSYPHGWWLQQQQLVIFVCVVGRM